MGHKVSVVVLNYNGAHLLKDCLESLLLQDHPATEIVVVDNASHDNSKEVVARYSNVRWLALGSNGGLGPGYNAGAESCSGEAIFFVNNDMRFETDCLRRLAETLADDQIFAVDPLQMDWEGNAIIHGAQRLQSRWHLNGFGVPFVLPYQSMNATDNVEVPWGCAGALMVRREMFEQLGGFDNSFFLDYEDVDLCWRAWLRGWKTVFVPAARLYHKVGESEDRRLRQNNPLLRARKIPRINARRRLSQCKNAQRFVLKTMPWEKIAGLLAIELFKISSSFLLLKPSAGFARWKALILNLSDLPEILRSRKKIHRESITNSISLLVRWGQSQNESLAS